MTDRTGIAVADSSSGSGPNSLPEGVRSRLSSHRSDHEIHTPEHRSLPNYRRTTTAPATSQQPAVSDIAQALERHAIVDTPPRESSKERGDDDVSIPKSCFRNVFTCARLYSAVPLICFYATEPDVRLVRQPEPFEQLVRLRRLLAGGHDARRPPHAGQSPDRRLADAHVELPLAPDPIQMSQLGTIDADAARLPFPTNGRAVDLRRRRVRSENGGRRGRPNVAAARGEAGRGDHDDPGTGPGYVGREGRERYRRGGRHRHRQHRRGGAVDIAKRNRLAHGRDREAPRRAGRDGHAAAARVAAAVRRFADTDADDAASADDRQPPAQPLRQRGPVGEHAEAGPRRRVAPGPVAARGRGVRPYADSSRRRAAEDQHHAAAGVGRRGDHFVLRAR